jgi:hypothetical protein
MVDSRRAVINPISAQISDLKPVSGEAPKRVLKAVELTLRSTKSPLISLYKGGRF